MQLNMNECSVLPDTDLSAKAEYSHWINREIATIAAPVEIDVTAFHEAAGFMHLMSWCCDAAQDTESFILGKKHNEDVTEIYLRCGQRYFWLRDHYLCSHAEIVKKVRVAFRLQR